LRTSSAAERAAPTLPITVILNWTALVEN